MREDAERWDGRYEGRVTGAPSMPKGLDEVELPDGGRCLDVACGLGEQSLWAVEHGYDVVALDASATAIAALRAAANERGVGDRVDTRVVDLDDGLPADVIGTCRLVICQRFRGVGLCAALVDALEPGGLLVITVLSEVGAATTGPFHAPQGELLDGFGRLDVEIVRHDEGDGEATLLARRSVGA